jgi:hypothetical protein
MRWAGHIACTIKKINACKVLVKQTMKKRSHFDDLDGEEKLK